MEIYVVHVQLRVFEITGEENKREEGREAFYRDHFRLQERPDALHFFAKFVTSECSEENIEFWHAVCRFLSSTTPYVEGTAQDVQEGTLREFKDEATRVIGEFIAYSAARQVNLPSACADACETAINEGCVQRCYNTAF